MAERLDLFVRRADELADTTLVRTEQLASQFGLRFEHGQALELSTKQPDEDQLRSFLMTFRQFVMESEPIYVNRVFRLLWVKLEGDQWRGFLTGARGVWESACRVGAIDLTLNESKIKPEHLSDCWINGWYFHNDRRKREAIEQLDPMGTILTRYLFLDHLVEVTRYVLYLRNVIVWARADGLLVE